MRLTILLLALSACASPPNGVSGDAIDSVGAAPTLTLDSLHRENADLQYSATVHFPVLANAGPHTDAINAMLRAEALRAIDHADFQPNPDLAETPVSERMMGDTIELGIDVDTERLDARLFSANRFVYAYTGGAHPNYWFDPANVDLATGEMISLGDLLLPGAASLEAVAAAAERALRAQGWDSDGNWADGLAPTADNFRDFTLGRDSLVLHFAPYQIGPYAAGSFRAAVAYSDLDDVLAADAPVR